MAASGYRNGMDCSVVLYSGAADAAVRMAMWQFVVGPYDGIVVRDGASEMDPVLTSMSGPWHIDVPVVYVRVLHVRSSCVAV